MKLTQNLVIGMNTISTLRRTVGVTTSEQLAEKMGVSVFFLQQVLLKLHRAKLVNRKRGPGGGYWLNSVEPSVTAQEVAQAVGKTFDKSNDGAGVNVLNEMIEEAFAQTKV